MNPFYRRTLEEYEVAGARSLDTHRIFLRELQRIADEYEIARRRGEGDRVNTLIDFELRTLLYQEQKSFIGISRAYSLLTTQEQAQSGVSVLHNEKWREFSQKLKSRASLCDLLQLVQNAD